MARAAPSAATRASSNGVFAARRRRCPPSAADRQPEGRSRRFAQRLADRPRRPSFLATAFNTFAFVFDTFGFEFGSERAAVVSALERGDERGGVDANVPSESFPRVRVVAEEHQAPRVVPVRPQEREDAPLPVAEHDVPLRVQL